MVYFEKTYPEPASLEVERTKTSGSYKEEDVLEQLYKDFHNKCYICETKGIESINVEHFEPHEKTCKIKKFNWSNLFWACSHCNTIKSNVYKKLLNCTVIEDSVDTVIKYDLDDSLPNNKVLIKTDSSDNRVVRTVELLSNVYNGTTIQNKFQAREKRNELYDELCDFSNIINKYIRTESDEKKEQLLTTIKYELSNKSKFTAFKRFYIRNNISLSFFEQFIS